MKTDLPLLYQLKLYTMSQSPNFLDAGLAKRLAEAADCLHDGKYHYFICKRTPPYELNYTKGYDTDEEASSAADAAKVELGDGYEKFGPYKTAPADAATFDYDAIQITFLKDTNPVYSETLEGDVDAIILSVSAYDKFFQPYYVRLYGIEVAKELRKQAVCGLTASAMRPAQHLGANNSALTANSKKKPGGTLLIVNDSKF